MFVHTSSLFSSSLSPSCDTPLDVSGECRFRDGDGSSGGCGIMNSNRDFGVGDGDRGI